LSALQLGGVAALNLTTDKLGASAGFNACVVLQGHQAYRVSDLNGVYKAKQNKSGSAKFKAK
jgi:hypothetical protein